MIEAFAIIVMLAILSILIIVHEIGHYSVARLFGFQTPVFGFGLPFGPYWIVGHKWGTQFRIHACLLGGYVAIPELGDETNATQENFGLPLKPFKKFPIWQRMLVAFAGVGFNILFAYLVMIIMFLTLGQHTQQVTVEKLPQENPIAAKAGVQVGDRIMAIDELKVSSSEDLIQYLGKRPNTEITLHVLRNGNEEAIKMTTNASGKVGMALGGPLVYTPVKGNFFEICGLAWERMWKLTASMLDALGMMFQSLGEKITHFGQKPPPQVAGKPSVGFEDLHGVLAVVKIGADIAQQDWSQLYLFTVMISLDLAIINLVPWPALDGGHIAFMMYEAVRGRPMGERAHGEIVKWGFISLLVLMAVIMVNDVRALLTGQLDFKKQKNAAPKDEKKIEDGAKKSEETKTGEQTTATSSATAASKTDGSGAPGADASKTGAAPPSGSTNPDTPVSSDGAPQTDAGANKPLPPGAEPAPAR